MSKENVKQKVRQAFGMLQSRKMEQELGIPAGTIPQESLQFVTRMEYEARMNEVWVEHEIDHILVTRAECQSESESKRN